MTLRNFSLVLVLVIVSQATLFAADPMKALIIDGQNNHGAWPKTTFMMKKYLEETKLFTVDIARTAFTTNGEDLLKDYPLKGFDSTPTRPAKTDPNFKPEFAKYDVVISNFGHGAAPWPKETQASLVSYMKNGGGLVIIHAADNSFGDWPEYNQMIGIGGWGGRSKQSGPYVYYNDDGKLVLDSSSDGRSGNHGSQHSFEIRIRDKSH
ncbi:MAG: ThuA domain-containing protein, partial [Rhodopirellula sp.]|nr:ThuA domain-containing protein [Rhodopirellula sp.]